MGIKRFTMVVLIFTLVLFAMSYKVKAEESDYTNHWAIDYINEFLELGYIELDDYGDFRPDDPITKAEFVAITNKVFDLDEPYFANFKDVKEDSYYNDFLFARQAGYLIGLPDGTVEPLGYTSRQEFAVIISRLLKLDLIEYREFSESFTDSASFPEWSLGGIGAVAHFNYMNGVPGGRFDPTGSVTRAQVVTVLARCYKDGTKYGYLGRNYYVSPDGRDDQAGTREEPFKTFDKALSVVEAGDTLYVLEGTYTERMVIRTSGTPGKPISIMAFPGHDVIIDGEGIDMPSWAGLIDSQDQSYIRISGFQVHNSPEMGIIATYGSDIVIDNNYTYNTWTPGINAWYNKNLQIYNNRIEKACQEGQGILECISLRNSDTFKVSNNTVFDSNNIGICTGENGENGIISDNDIFQVGLGIYVGAWDKHADGIDVYNNYCYENDTGIAVNVENGGVIEHVNVFNNFCYDNARYGFAMGWGGVFETTHTVKHVNVYNNVFRNNDDIGMTFLGVKDGTIEDIGVYNNLIYDNKRTGISISGVAKAPFDYSITDIRIINNTILNNGSEDMWGSGGIFLYNQENAIGTIDDITIRNNILSDNLQFSVGILKVEPIPTNVIVEYNLYNGYKNDMNGYGEVLGNNYVMGVPSFKDVGDNDFRLKKESIAIDAGSDIEAPGYDYSGTVRPGGNGVDIGAFEWTD